MMKARRTAITKQLEKRNSVLVDDCIIVKDWSYARGTEYSLKDKRDYHTIDVSYRLDDLLDLL